MYMHNYADSADSSHVHFGDIILTPEQEAVLRGETWPGISAFRVIGQWPNGIVPYTINVGLGESYCHIIL